MCKNDTTSFKIKKDMKRIFIICLICLISLFTTSCCKDCFGWDEDGFCWECHNCPTGHNGQYCPKCKTYCWGQCHGNY